MPFQLVIILAPKFCYINESGEVSVRRPVAAAAQPAPAVANAVVSNDVSTRKDNLGIAADAGIGTRSRSSSISSSMAVASKPGDVPVRSSITQAASAASGMSSSGGTDTPPIVTNVSQEIKRIESTSRADSAGSTDAIGASSSTSKALHDPSRPPRAPARAQSDGRSQSRSISHSNSSEAMSTLLPTKTQKQANTGVATTNCTGESDNLLSDAINILDTSTTRVPTVVAARNDGASASKTAGTSSAAGSGTRSPEVLASSSGVVVASKAAPAPTASSSSTPRDGARSPSSTVSTATMKRTPPPPPTVSIETQQLDTSSQSSVVSSPVASSSAHGCTTPVVAPRSASITTMKIEPSPTGEMICIPVISPPPPQSEPEQPPRQQRSPDGEDGRERAVSGDGEAIERDARAGGSAGGSAVDGCNGDESPVAPSGTKRGETHSVSGNHASDSLDSSVHSATGKSVTSDPTPIKSTTSSGNLQLPLTATALHAIDEVSSVSSTGSAPAPTTATATAVPSSSTAVDNNLKWELESVSTGVAVNETVAVLTEVNIRAFVMQEMDNMYQEYVICARPTLVDDETGNSIQAMCIVEREMVDQVIARLAYYGVGNLVGSINVLTLESSKFFRAVRPPPPPPATKDGEAAGEGVGKGGEDNAAVTTVVGADGVARTVPTVESAADAAGAALVGLSRARGNSVASVDNGLLGGGGAATSMLTAAAAAAEEQRKKRAFINDVASEIRVEQVIEQIEDSAEMDFDYCCLLCVASTIAGIGLATNNTVVIVASMLVSPIMGPVLALTFGSIIHNWPLMRLGLTNELLSLAICIVIGFLIGVVAILVGTDGTWPTPEMRGRGLAEGLALGLAIAVPSGMGVALSVLGNNTSSLVGVAISASLLPPAVNCGMAFAYAAFGFQVDPDAIGRRGNTDDDDPDFSTPFSYVQMGGISLALTAVNIGAIFLSGFVMFRIKEVAPIKNKQAFWERDTQVFRRLMTQLNHAPAAADDDDDGDDNGEDDDDDSGAVMDGGILADGVGPAGAHYSPIEGEAHEGDAAGAGAEGEHEQVEGSSHRSAHSPVPGGSSSHRNRTDSSTVSNRSRGNKSNNNNNRLSRKLHRIKVQHEIRALPPDLLDELVLSGRANLAPVHNSPLSMLASRDKHRRNRPLYSSLEDVAAGAAAGTGASSGGLHTGRRSAAQHTRPHHHPKGYHGLGLLELFREQSDPAEDVLRPGSPTRANRLSFHQGMRNRFDDGYGYGSSSSYYGGAAPARVNRSPSDPYADINDGRGGAWGIGAAGGEIWDGGRSYSGYDRHDEREAIHVPHKVRSDTSISVPQAGAGAAAGGGCAAGADASNFTSPPTRKARGGSQAATAPAAAGGSGGSGRAGARRERNSSAAAAQLADRHTQSSAARHGTPPHYRGRGGDRAGERAARDGSAWRGPHTQQEPPQQQYQQDYAHYSREQNYGVQFDGRYEGPHYGQYGGRDEGPHYGQYGGRDQGWYDGGAVGPSQPQQQQQQQQQQAPDPQRFRHERQGAMADLSEVMSRLKKQGRTVTTRKRVTTK